MVEKAKKILSDVHPDVSFKLLSGGELKNLKHLLDELKDMNVKTFLHHVTPDRNDFANWINDVLEDKDLAEELSYSYDKEQMGQLIKNRILELQSIVQKPADFKSFENLLTDLKNEEEQTSETTEVDDIDEVRNIYGLKLTKEITNKIHYITWGILAGLILGLVLGLMLR
ncbi:MAG: hypothetical protein ABIG89_02565 [Candidatus Woesearchaeota archaeon]